MGHVHIAHTIGSVRQTGEYDCWAASLAMVAGQRQGRHLWVSDIRRIAADAHVGLDSYGALRRDDAANAQRLANALGLRFHNLRATSFNIPLIERLLRPGRLAILDFMEGIIAEPRSELSPHAPRITTLVIPVDKIGGLIGPGGKNIRRITELSGAQIDIEEDGTVSIFASNGEAMALAVREVEAISMEPEEGRIYEGTVTGIKEFGAFVEILPGQDGLCHISELADTRIRAVEDVCKVGDKMWVKVIAVDDRGRVKLSRREAMRDRDKAAAAPTA